MDLRRFAGLGRKQSDEEIAAEETGGDDAIALVGDTWSVLSRRRWQVELLTVTDQGGIRAAAGWLDERDLAWKAIQRQPKRNGPRPRSTWTNAEARAVLVSSPRH